MGLVCDSVRILQTVGSNHALLSTLLECEGNHGGDGIEFPSELELGRSKMDQTAMLITFKFVHKTLCFRGDTLEQESPQLKHFCRPLRTLIVRFDGDCLSFITLTLFPTGKTALSIPRSRQLTAVREHTKPRHPMSLTFCRLAPQRLANSRFCCCMCSADFEVR